VKKYRVIAIDGPAGSGKSTTARLLAEKLKFTYLDTGAMYRCVTLAALERGINIRDEARIGRLAGAIDLAIVPDPGGDRVLLAGRDVTAAIRTPKVDADVSLVSAYKIVREKMVGLQRKFASESDVVAEGRDIGTVVFPDADLKIFLTADLETRAVRRCRQLEGFGLKTTLDEQAAALSSRDLFDSERANSPLKKADDAIELDTSGMSINEEIEAALNLARAKLGVE
jgi:cytidylate kinase